MKRSMRTRSLVLLLILMVVAAAGTIAQDIRFGAAIKAERSAAASTDLAIASTQINLADFRTAQAAYIAAGQGPAFWMTRADDLSAAENNAIKQLKDNSASPEAAAHYDEALAAMAELEKLDGRAKSYVKTDQRLLASDVIFQEGTGISQRATKALTDARDVERSASEARISKVERIRMAMTAGCLVVAILFAALLLRATLVWTSPAASTEQSPAVQTDAPQAIDPKPAVASPEINLTDAAELCLDLARVLDARDVGALFDRAAMVLEAKGLVLWAVDTSGAILRPTLTHGYTEKVLARMSGLQVDSDNATALAFRSMQAQVVPGQAAGASGAVAVPLITANGCVGVLSAEIKRGRPGKDTVAVSKMIAAQLSALVAPGGEATAAAAN